MRLLLDTEVFIWVLQDHPRLSKRARAMIMDASGVYVSAVSIWELAVKSRFGKASFELDRVVEAIEASGMAQLPITIEHITGLAKIPVGVRDSFDQMLLAQALTEPLLLMSANHDLATRSELVIPI